MDPKDKWLTDHLNNMDWGAVLSNPDPAVRLAAVVALQQAGPQAAAYSPMLLNLLDDPDQTVRARAAGALGTIGNVDSSARDRLSFALSDESARVRVGVAQLLWKLAADPASLLPVLIAGLKDDDPFVRWNAATVLGDMGPVAAPALTALEWALHDRDDGVQMHAARALGNVGAAADRVVPALISLFREHSSRRVQTQGERLHLVVHAALHSFGVAAVPHLTKAIAEDGDDFRLRILSVLGHLGHLAAPALPALVGLLGHDNPAMRRRAAFVVGQIGPDAETVAPSLQKLLADADPTVRVAAAQALWRIGSWSDSAWKILMNAVIEDRTPAAARINAIAALGGLGPAASEAVPVLRRILSGGSMQNPERQQAALALGQITGDMSGIEACLDESLRDDDPESRVQMLRILPMLGAAGKQFLAQVDQLGSDPNAIVRTTAVAVAKRMREI
jgi:HEAT repeat protein